jgi:hypothetical protein
MKITRRMLILPGLLIAAGSYQVYGAGTDVMKYLIIDPAMRFIFIFGVMGSWMYAYGMSFSNNFDKMILANPSVADPSAPLFNQALADLMGLSIRMLTPVYVLAILAVAYYMLFLQASSHGRAKAKDLLTRLVLSLIFFSASPLLFEALMQVSYALSNAIMSPGSIEKARTVLQGGIWLFAKIGITDLELAIPFWGSLYAMAWTPYVILHVRYLMITLMGIVFPLGIVLYSFNFMRGIGRKILEQSLVWIFMQVFLSTAVVAIAFSINLYSVIPAENNASISGINLIPIPDPRDAIGLFAPSIPAYTTILAFSLGAAAYGLLFAVPLMMVRLLGHFLP